jgi:formylmethanofuran dehydrogenase subunit E
MKTFQDVVKFHGHTCPGLALGYRVAKLILKELGQRSTDEEIVAIVENNSCAVDAVQVMTGCTFGKGNLIFRDYGKQVYTFIRRSSGRGIRISVEWTPPEETEEEKKMWSRYSIGDRTRKVVESVHKRKAGKVAFILNAKDSELLKVRKGRMKLPGEAEIYRSIPCSSCGERVMETRARVKDGRIVCIPCSDE